VKIPWNLAQNLLYVVPFIFLLKRMLVWRQAKGLFTDDVMVLGGRGRGNCDNP